MLYLYNEFFSFLPKVKKLLGKAGRGPDGVFNSLVKGLNELKVKYKINQVPSVLIETACVFSGITTLGRVIEQKRKGLIKKIFAGPNIVVTPEDCGGILKSPEIDKIIVPSQWVKDFYASIAPGLKPKIYVWAAGVDLPKEEPVGKEYDFLVLNKIHSDMGLFDVVAAYLKEQEFRAHFLFYGHFKQEQYFNALKYTKYLVYLPESESQGLALFEAWARGIPTLVWDRQFMQHGQYKWQGNTSAPYLSSNTGMSFKNFEEFKSVLPIFLKQKFSPREWVKNNATNEIAAKKYLEIIRQ